MKHSALILSFIAFTVCAADQAYGQAIVGYGINVGRAGAAGAAAGATGAGAAGIFSKLNSRLDEKPNTQSGARTAQPEFDGEELRSSEQRQAPSFSTSGTVETSSGVRISGHRSTPPPVTPARYQARSLDYEPDPSPAPSAAPSTAGQAEPLGEAPQGQAEQAAEPEHTPEAGGAAPVPTSGNQQTPHQSHGQPVSVTEARIAPSGQEAPAQNSAPKADPSIQQLLRIDSAIADIAEGTSIEAVIERFGKPIFKMTGLPGQGYSEKYIFRTADGRRFTVFTQGGMVAEILVEPLVLGKRAAL